MDGSEHHVMELVGQHEGGAEEWFCAICRRRFVMQWPPAYKKIVLEPGDEYAIHSGGKGGLEIGSVELHQGQAESSPETAADAPLSDEMLRPWQQFLDEADLGDL